MYSINLRNFFSQSWIQSLWCCLAIFIVCGSVSCTGEKSMTSQSKKIQFKTPFYQRSFEDSKEGFKTLSFESKPDGTALIKGTTEDEGRIIINGREYVLGGELDNSIAYSDFKIETTPLGAERLTVSFKGADGLSKGIVVKAIYECPADVPALLKWISIENQGDSAIYLNGMQTESFTPEVSGKMSLILENDYVRGAMKVSGENARSPWIEKQHLYVDTLLDIKSEPTTFSYPVEIDRWISIGESFSSFKVYEFIAPTGNEELRGIAFRRATRKMFPWTSIRYLHCALVPSNNIEDYRLGIDTAAQAGYEGVLLAMAWVDGDLTSPLFTNFSDYIPRKELFPNGWADVKALTDYAHSKDIKMSFYTIYVNTWDKRPSAEMDNQWTMKWAEDDKSSRWGRTLDPATGWGLQVNRKLEETMKKGGFDSWHMDGPYYGDVCVAENHTHKPGCNQVLAWERLSGWYQRQKAMGYHGEAAQGFCAYPHGMSRVTTTGYVEGDFGHMGMEGQILATRAGAYTFTKVYRPAQAVTFVPVMPWSPKKDAPSLIPMDEKVKLYNAYISFCFGYGFGGRIHQKVAFDGPKSKAAIQRWTGFWKDHTDYFFKGFLLHLRKPDGKRIDAIAHYLVEGDSHKLLVVAYNPLKDESTDEIALPLDVVPEGTWKVVSESGNEQVVKNGKLKVTVPGMDATWYEMTMSKETGK